MAESDLARLGKAVKRHRKVLGVTQEELAHRAGFHRTYVGQVERGERNPSFKSLLSLAQALSISPDALLKTYLNLTVKKKK